MIGAIVQARMGSSRLPNKVMMPINEKPLLAYCIERIRQSKYIDQVIIATTTEPQDDVIFNWCNINNIACYRGSENDVLDRYYQAAQHYDLDIVVRVTSDCPFVDSKIIDMLITNLLVQDCDYTSNRWKKRSWPHGLDVEVMTNDALSKAWENADKPHEREHVTPYILEHSEVFHIIEMPYHKNLSDIRLTVDYKEDMEFVSKLLPLLHKQYGMNYKWQNIIKILQEYPELSKLNQSVVNTKLY